MQAYITSTSMAGQKSPLMENQPTCFQKFLRSEGAAFYGFISIWLLGLIFLLIFPVAVAVVISFTNFNGINISGTVFTGFSNYIEAFQSPDAWYTMRQTLLYSVLVIPLSLGAALGLALLLNKKILGKGFFRTAFYLPTIIPIGASALVFKSILDGNSGFLNLLISIFRPGTAINWINEYGLYALVIFGIWGCGTALVVFLAGLQEIPPELEEAAAIDGAGKWQIFKHVTWPLLSPITYFQLMLGVINSLQMFVPANIISQTSDATSYWTPQHSMYMFPAYAMNQMMAVQRFGYGVSLVWILFLLALAITFIIRKSSHLWVYYAVDQEGGKTQNEEV
jgi:ABC-type sugar transport systems, permease components